MQPLDGNAIAGDLLDHFGREMTAVSGTCRSCGATALVAELHVYVSGPGTVARCPSCGAATIVVAAGRVHLAGIALDG
jgi:hypothetical protein